ncbi:MAG: T9SS type A sorting domain-containing protein, partial [Bacteroidetes bacterium]|nr:T9SS type A sorting domain-containing protein [Bacteroidota bacterium]
ANGAVSHLPWTEELWDDTVYMIGVFLIAMYKATGNEEYLDELIEQIRFHQEKLRDVGSGLWVHGWDQDGIYTFDFCSQADWADETTGRSQKLWGRGNGWVIVTLSELLNTMEETHPDRTFIEHSLLEMISQLPEWQDATTGHWYQLPARPDEEGNFIESSCTAMFGYGILTALKHELVQGPEFESAVRKAYFGLRDHSTFAIDPQNPYLNTRNVCAETCIGDRDYYFSRDVANGRSYALAMDIIFGRSFEDIYMNDVPTGVNEANDLVSSFHIYPTLSSPNASISLEFHSNENVSIKTKVVDISGRLVYQASENVRTGKNIISLQIPNLPKGAFFVLLKNQQSGTVAASQFIVQ